MRDYKPTEVGVPPNIAPFVRKYWILRLAHVNPNFSFKYRYAPISVNALNDGTFDCLTQGTWELLPIFKPGTPTSKRDKICLQIRVKERDEWKQIGFYKRDLFGIWSLWQTHLVPRSYSIQYVKKGKEVIV